ncbi:hypothetical protein ACS15_2623 [Ralstonia insidiosa]|uniref:Uncharacterized protein n=1 Tax=Ralstonia insidiosa TaxID=190721 RepID=A0AAC9BGX3_9RALS|nr:hypothetical protein ACS15_2623 [Ralstonia insidiosa]
MRAGRRKGAAREETRILARSAAWGRCATNGGNPKLGSCGRTSQVV